MTSNNEPSCGGLQEIAPRVDGVPHITQNGPNVELEVGMLGAFLNRRDGDAVGDMYREEADRAAQRNGAELRKMMVERMSFEELVAERDELIVRLTAEINSYVDVISDLVDLENPVILEQLRQLRSRHLDAELDKMLAAGQLRSDPRLDAEWCAEKNYRP